MDSKIWASVITSGVVFVTLIYNMYRNHQQFKRAKEDSKYKAYYEQVKDRRDKIQMKIDEFYSPLKNYLAQSKINYLMLVGNKPEGFRTLEYLLDNDKEFNGEKVSWTNNDDILLDKILSYGKLMEDLILNKMGLIDDPEICKEYLPSPGFDDIEYPEDMSILDIAVAHFSFIRDARKDLGGDQRFEKYVYPRELSRKINSKLDELQLQVAEENQLMVKYMNKIGGNS